MSVINWGIIGLGNIANKFASAFKNLKNSKLISVASNNQEKIENFKKQYNLKNSYCYNQYEQMLSNKDIDRWFSKEAYN